MNKRRQSRRRVCLCGGNHRTRRFTSKLCALYLLSSYMGCAGSRSESESVEVVDILHTISERVKSAQSASRVLHAESEEDAAPSRLDDATLEWVREKLAAVIDAAKKCKLTKKVLDPEALNQALIAKNLLSRSFPDSYSSLKHLLVLAIETIELYVEVDHESIRDNRPKAASLSSPVVVVLQVPIESSESSPSQDLPPPPPLTREHRRPSCMSPRNASFSVADSPQMLTLSGKITQRKQLSWDSNLVDDGRRRSVVGDDVIPGAPGGDSDPDFGFYDTSGKSSPASMKASPSPSVQLRKSFFGDDFKQQSPKSAFGSAPLHGRQQPSRDTVLALRNALLNKRPSTSLGELGDVQAQTDRSETDRSPTGLAGGPAMA